MKSRESLCRFSTVHEDLRHGLPDRHTHEPCTGRSHFIVRTAAFSLIISLMKPPLIPEEARSPVLGNYQYPPVSLLPHIVRESLHPCRWRPKPPSGLRKLRQASFRSDLWRILQDRIQKINPHCNRKIWTISISFLYPWVVSDERRTVKRSIPKARKKKINPNAKWISKSKQRSRRQFISFFSFRFGISFDIGIF